MPPWESFQGRETGEWKRDICAFIRTRRRRKEDKPASFFGLVQKIFFCVPLGLLHNGDYATSYSRNVSIPAAHQNTDFSRQGMYVWIIWPTIYLYIFLVCWSLVGSCNLVEVILWVNDTCHFWSRGRKTQRNPPRLNVAFSNYFNVTSGFIVSSHTNIIQWYFI